MAYKHIFISLIAFLYMIIPGISQANDKVLSMDSNNKYKLITIEEFTNKGSSILKQKQSKVTFPLSVDDLELIAYLKEKCKSFGGVGLAAPQVNADRNIAVIYIPESAALLRENSITYPMHVIINANYEPVLTDGTYEDFEACYSVKSVMGKVKRYKSIKVKYQNEQGEVIEKIATGFYARVLQHEIDHLNGLLITDRFDKDSLYGSPTEMMKIRRKELTPDKRIEYDRLLKQKNISLEE